MSERFETTDGTTRILRLRTDDGPVVELALSVTARTIDAQVSFFDPFPGGALSELGQGRLRERRGVVLAIAKLITKATPDPEDLWTAMATAYNRHATRFAKARNAAQSAADAAAAAAPEIDKDAVISEITRQALERLAP